MGDLRAFLVVRTQLEKDTYDECECVARVNL